MSKNETWNIGPSIETEPAQEVHPLPYFYFIDILQYNTFTFVISEDILSISYENSKQNYYKQT